MKRKRQEDEATPLWYNDRNSEMMSGGAVN